MHIQGLFNGAHAAAVSDMAVALEVQQPSKRSKVENPVASNSANVIVQLRAGNGDPAGSQLAVPHTVTVSQLETLLNGLLENEERLPYSFFLHDVELSDELGAHMLKNNVSVESVLEITYQPQAIFRVRPVARCSASMNGHSEAVLSTAFSPDGKRLATGSGDTTVRFWDLNTCTPSQTMKVHKTWVLCVAWSPDGKFLVSGSKDGQVAVWDSHAAELKGFCKGHSKWITSVAWEPAHLRLPARRFVTGSQDKSIRVWDAVTLRCCFSMSGHSLAVSCVRWGGDGLLYSASRDTNINVWDSREGKMVRSLKGHGHWVNTLALSTECVLRTGAYDHNGQCPSDLEAARQAALERYNTATGGQPERLVSGSDDFTMFLWEPSTSKKPLARMTGHMQLINQVQFSPDGRWVVSASFDKALKLWDGLKGVFVATFRGHVGPVYQISWASDSRMFVSGSKDSTLKVWDVRSRKLKMDLPGHADEIYAVDWSPDGSMVASGGKDRVVKLWRS